MEDPSHPLREQGKDPSLNPNMRKVERFPERRMYKMMLGLLKVIPMLLALSTILGTLFDFLGLDASAFSFIGGISFLPLLFLYLSSYVFRFCVYHRMFLHYIVANNILTYADYLFGIPISTIALFSVHLILIGIFLFLVLYFYRREKCCRRSRNFCSELSMI